MNKSTPTKRPLPLPKNNDDDYEVVWSGTSTRYGERGQLLPDTHNVGSTWSASVDRIRKRIDAINKRDVDG